MSNEQIEKITLIRLGKEKKDLIRKLLWKEKVNVRVHQ